MRKFYDIETFKNYFLIVAQREDWGYDEFEVLENPTFIELVNFINDGVLVGFNNHRFDDPVIASMLTKVEAIGIPYDQPIPPMWAYEFSQEIIMNQDNKYFSGLDVVTEDVMRYRGFDTMLNLKSFESVLGMEVVESAYDFHEPLSEDGKLSTLNYCKHDVVATRKAFEMLQDKGNVSAIENLRIFVGEKLGVKPETLVKSSPNSMLIKLLKNPSYDRKNFFNYIDSCEFDYAFSDPDFKEWYDKISTWVDTPLETQMEIGEPVLEFERNNVEYRFAKGGGHGHNFEKIFADCEHDDFSSLYPSIMILILALGEECTELFEEIVNTRLEAKRTGNKSLANALKLIINSIYGLCRSEMSGAQLFNKYLGLDVCIVGQVMLYDLALRIEAKGGTLINVNTDGIIYKSNGNDLEIRHTINDFAKRVRIGIENDKMAYYFAEHVNSYFVLDEEFNTIETKGTFSKKPYYNNLASPQHVIDTFVAELKGEEPPSMELLFERNPEAFILRAKNTKVREFTFGLSEEYDRYGKRGQLLKKKGYEFYPLYEFGHQFRGYAVTDGYSLKNKGKNKKDETTYSEIGTLKTAKHPTTTYSFTLKNNRIDYSYYEEQSNAIINSIKH